MPSDPRIGTKSITGEITYLPEKYADGSTFNRSGLQASTLVFLNTLNFVALPPGVPNLSTISPSLKSELEGLIGGSASIGTYIDTVSRLGLKPIGPFGLFDDFEGSTLSTANWAVDVNGTGASATLPNSTGLSLASLVTGTADNGHATIASNLTFSSSSKLLLLETRLKVDDIADVQIEFGFSDAQTEVGGQVFTSVGTPAANASNAVLFEFLNDVTGGASVTGWHASYVKSGVKTSTLITANSAPVTITPATFVKLALALAVNGSQVDAKFFVNGEPKASKKDVTALNTPLYVWISTKTFEDADSKTLDIDYVRVTQSRD